MLNATLRGMFDTDGGIAFDRRQSYKKPYIRINYTSSSEDLVKQIHNILIRHNIKHSFHSNNPKANIIQINGEKNVKSFLNKIGFSNPRHLVKIKYLV